MHLLLTFLLHAQREHSVEVWTGNSQQGSVSRDSLVISHQNHIAEFPVLPLFIEALQDLHRLIHTVENLHPISKKKKRKKGIVLSVKHISIAKFRRLTLCLHLHTFLFFFLNRDFLKICI